MILEKKRRTIYDPVEIVDIAQKGLCIGRCDDGRAILVEHVVPGDVVAAEGVKKRKGMIQARVRDIHKLSEHRTPAFCRHFGVCGGCKWQNMDYAAQLQFKEKAVRENFRRLAKIPEPEILPILGSASDRRYRNKLQFSFTDQRWLTEEEINSGKTFENRLGLGFHVAGAFAHVVDIEECFLMPEPVNSIRNFIRNFAIENGIPFHDIRTHKGFLRTLTIKSNRNGEFMVILTVTEDKPDIAGRIIDTAMARFPEIRSAFLCINDKANDSDLDLPRAYYAGAEFLDERLGDVLFRIGPKSFFQTNPDQAERLFAIAREFADVGKDETVYDLYTGIGSIALAVARSCKHVVGIEEIGAAIEDARLNAEINGIGNTDFVCGDVKNVLDDDFIRQYGPADVIFTDPPRAGMHNNAIDFLLKAGPSRIVYISCNPPTQARDIALLSEQYRFMKAQPVDMFPHTSHIENIALLQKKSHG